MDFIADYLDYRKHTEPPYIYHRWCALASVGALLGRNYFLQHGAFRIFPNIYCMLVGEAAARKSTAIKLAKIVVSGAGYENFAADKTTKEKFLLDLEGELDSLQDDPKVNGKAVYNKLMSENLWGSQDEKPTDPKEVFIAADEFNEFCGTGNLEFYTTLGNLWDWDNETKPFTQRVKNTKSVSIWQPTVSLLGGNTPENFSKAFPPEIIGQGFLSRMILIHGERSGRKYPFPPIPDEGHTKGIISQLMSIRSSNLGQAEVSANAMEILSSLYYDWIELEDVRFKTYSNRRFSHLLKLCLIVSAGCGSRVISDEVVIRANTYLTAAESIMPKALGEFGKSKNSDVANKVMVVLTSADKPLSLKDIWKHVHKDLDNTRQLADLMQSLNMAEKIFMVTEGPAKGWLPKRSVSRIQKYVDVKWLTEEERIFR